MVPPGPFSLLKQINDLDVEKSEALDVAHGEHRSVRGCDARDHHVLDARRDFFNIQLIPKTLFREKPSLSLQTMCSLVGLFIFLELNL